MGHDNTSKKCCGILSWGCATTPRGAATHLGLTRAASSRALINQAKVNPIVLPLPAEVQVQHLALLTIQQGRPPDTIITLGRQAHVIFTAQNSHGSPSKDTARL